MYKGKSASMQRGAMERYSPLATPTALAKLAERPFNAKMTDDELIEFNSVAMPRHVLLDNLRPIVAPLRRQTPLKIATHLNVAGWRTAQGRRWNARLVYLLLAFLSGKPLPRIPARKKPAAQHPRHMPRRPV